MPGVGDGNLNCIHDARVATRRIREVLPLTYEWQPRHAIDDLQTRFKRLGRSLGRVRDTDVRIELLRYLESRNPAALPALVEMRQQTERERVRQMRKLVKRIERLGVEGALDRIANGASWHRARFWVAAAGWRNRVRQLVVERAETASTAIVHATGVYFPNRSHAARIAIKKLRYAVEIAAQIRNIADERLMTELKRAQDLLGDLHDRQTLIDDLPGTVHAGPALTRSHLVAQAAGAEIMDLHRRFLERRARLLLACEGARKKVQQPSRSTAALALAGLAAVAGLQARRRLQRLREDEFATEQTRRMRIPVSDSLSAPTTR
jgi:CHAD domain-containing protein